MPMSKLRYSLLRGVAIPLFILLAVLIGVATTTVQASSSIAPVPPPSSYAINSSGGIVMPSSSWSAASRVCYTGEKTPCYTGREHTYYAPTTNGQTNPESKTLFITNGTSCPDYWYAYIEGSFNNTFVNKLYYIGYIPAGSSVVGSWSFNQTSAYGTSSLSSPSANPYNAPVDLGGSITGHATVWVGYENPDVGSNGYNTDCASLSPIWIDQYPAGTSSTSTSSTSIATGGSACSYVFNSLNEATNYNCGSSIMDLYTDTKGPNAPTVDVGSISGGTVNWNVTDNGDVGSGTGANTYTSGTQLIRTSGWFDNTATNETSGQCGVASGVSGPIKGSVYSLSQTYTQCNETTNTTTGWPNVLTGSHQGYVAHFCAQAEDWLGNFGPWACNYTVLPIGTVGISATPNPTTVTYPVQVTATSSPAYDPVGDNVVIGWGVTGISSSIIPENASVCSATNSANITISPGQQIEFVGAGGQTCAVTATSSVPTTATFTAYLENSTYSADLSAPASVSVAWDPWSINLSASPNSLPTTYSSVLDAAPTNGVPSGDVPNENIVIYDASSGVQSVQYLPASDCGTGTVSGDPISLYSGDELIFQDAGTLANCYVNVESNTAGTYQFGAMLVNPVNGQTSAVSFASVSWGGWTVQLTGNGQRVVDALAPGENALLQATSNFPLSQQGTSQTLNVYAATVSGGVYSPTGGSLFSCTTGSTCPSTGAYSFPMPASNSGDCVAESYVDACFIAEITSGTTVLAQSDLLVEWDAKIPTPPPIQATTGPQQALVGTPQYFWVDQPYPQTQTLYLDGQAYTFTPQSVTWAYGDATYTTEVVSTNGTSGGGWGTPPASGTLDSNITHVYQTASGATPYVWQATLNWEWTTTVNGVTESGYATSSTPKYSLVANQVQTGYSTPSHCTLSESPASGTAGVGASVTITATCPPASVQSYEIVVQSTTSGTSTVVQGWTTNTTGTDTATWTTTNDQPGEYYIDLNTSDLTSNQCLAADTSCGTTSVLYALNACSVPVLDITPVSPQLVGVTVNIAATSTCSGGLAPEYQFSETLGTTTTVLQSYSTTSTYAWNTTGVSPGSYQITVSAYPSGASPTAASSASQPYVLAGPCTSSSVVVDTPNTSNQLTSTATGTNVTINGSATCPAGDNPTFAFFYTPPGGTGLTAIPGNTWSIASSVGWTTPNSPTGVYTITMEVSSLGGSTPDATSAGTATTTLDVVPWSLSLSQSASSINVGQSDTVTGTANGSLTGTGYADRIYMTQTAFAHDVLTYGAQSFWPLSDTGTTTALDYSGNDNTGQLTNVTEGAGASPLVQSGQTVDGFAGTGYIMTPNSFTNPENFTVAAWFKTSSPSGGILGFECNAAGGSPCGWDRLLYVGASGHLDWGVCSSACPTIISSPGVVDNGQWHLAVAEQDSSGLQLYLDGTLVASSTQGTYAQNMTAQWTVGEIFGSSWPDLGGATGWIHFNGQLSNVAIMPENLSATQISTLYDDSGQPDRSTQIANCSTGTTCSGLATPTAAGGYNLQGQLSTNPTTYSNVLALMVHASCGSPIISASPANSQAAGNSVTFTASSQCSNGAAPEYQFLWSDPADGTSGVIQGYSTNNSATWSTTPTMAQAYVITVNVMAEWGTATQASASMNYNLTPTPPECSGVTVTPSSTSVPSTQSVLFSASATCPNASGSPAVYYQWTLSSYPGNSPLATETGWVAGGDQYTLSNGLATGWYDMLVQVTNNPAFGAQAEAKVAFAVGEPAPPRGCSGVSIGSTQETAQAGATVTIQTDALCRQYNYVQDARNDGAAAYWPLNSTSTTVTDATGNGNNGTMVGSVTAGPGISTGGSLYFNGSDYVSIPTTPISPSYQYWSISAWIMPSALPTASHADFIYYSSSNFSNGYGLAVGSINDGSGSNLEVLLGAVAWINDGVALPSSCTTQWCFVAVKRNINGYYFYVNNALVALVSSTAVPNPPSAGAEIGYANGGDYFVGDIADVMVSGYALQGQHTFPAQLTQLWDYTRSGGQAPTYYYTWTPPPESSQLSTSANSGATYALNTSGFSPGVWTIRVSLSDGNGTYLSYANYYLTITSGANAAGSCTGVTLGGGGVVAQGMGLHAMSAAANGCAAGTVPLYYFTITKPDGTSVAVQAPSQDSVWQWVTQGYRPGTYTVTVTAYDNNSGAVLGSASTNVLLSPPQACSSVRLTDSAVSVNTNQSSSSDTFTATATCLTGTPEYQFYLSAPGTSANWVVEQSFSTNNTWTWNASSAATGTWMVLVWVSDSGYGWPPQASDLITVYSGPTASWPPSVSSPTASCSGGSVGASPAVAQIGSTVALQAHLNCPFPGFYGPNYSNDMAQLGANPFYPPQVLANLPSNTYSNATLANSQQSYWPLNSISSTVPNYNNYLLSYGAYGYWPLSDTGTTTAQDISGNNNPGSLVGGVTENAATGPIASAPAPVMRFDGSGQYIQIPNISIYDIGNSSFSLSFWIDPATVTPAYQMLFTKDVSNGASNAQFEVRLHGNILQAVAPGGGIPASWTGVSANTWLQVTETYYNGTYTLYVNGQLASAGTGTVEDSNTDPIYIGTRNDMGNYYDGLAADFVFSDTTLTSEQVSQSYLNAVVTQSTPDLGASGDTGYLMGTPTISGTGPEASNPVGAMTFNGNGQWIATYDSNVPSTNLTMGVWFKTTSANVSIMGDTSSQIAGSASHDKMFWIGSNGELYFGAYNGALNELNTSFAVNNGQWQFAVASIGGAGTFLYLNGQLVTSNTAVTSTTAYAGWLRIGFADTAGWPNAAASDVFTGQLADAFLNSDVLPENAVNQIYTSAIVRQYSPSLYGGNNAMPIGGASVSSGAGPLAIPGSQNYFYMNSGAPSYFTTADEIQIPTTVSEVLWFRTSQANDGLMSFQSNQSGQESGGWNLQMYVDSNGDLRFGVAGSSFTTVATGSPVDNGQWHMAVATVSSSGYSLYLDGNYVGGNTSTPASQYGWWRVGDVNGVAWAYGNGGPEWMTGSIADAAVIPSALTASQVNALYVDATTPPAAYSFNWMAISPSGGSLLLGTGQSNNFNWNTSNLAPGGWLVGYYIQNYEGTGYNAFTSMTLQAAAPTASTCSGASISNGAGGQINYPTTTVFTANASCTQPGYAQYQFTLTDGNNGTTYVVQPYGPSNTYSWNNAMYYPGNYTITVNVESDSASAVQSSASVPVSVVWAPISVGWSCGSTSTNPCSSGATATITFTVPTMINTNLSVGAYSNSGSTLLAFCSADETGSQSGAIPCDDSAVFSSSPNGLFTLNYTPPSGTTAQTFAFKLFESGNLSGPQIGTISVNVYWG